MKAPAVFILATFAAGARFASAQGQAPPPPAPRAIQFADTLGAAFAIGDSATGTGTPDDFNFLVGTWQFTFQQRRPDGTFSPAFNGHWFAERKRMPNAFMEDHFRADAPNRTIEEGTWTYRVFSPVTKLWQMEGVDGGSGSWAPGLCWSDAANRYVIQRYGTSIMRIRYLNLADNSFLWRADMSRDGGKTWILDWWTMQTKRIAK